MLTCAVDLCFFRGHFRTLCINSCWWFVELSYLVRPQPLLCPTPQDICEAQDFIDFVNALNGDGSGCCVVGPGFADMGCTDFLNPAVVNIPECLLYRRRCPANACGPGQVVDRATFLCRAVL